MISRSAINSDRYLRKQGCQGRSVMLNLSRVPTNDVIMERQPNDDHMFSPSCTQIVDDIPMDRRLKEAGKIIRGGLVSPPRPAMEPMSDDSESDYSCCQNFDRKMTLSDDSDSEFTPPFGMKRLHKANN